MGTILLAWNPRRFPWGQLDDELNSGRREGRPSLRWSVGRSRLPKVGERALLIRLGVPPKGIVASAWITSTPYEDEHRDLDRAAAGDTARCACCGMSFAACYGDSTAHLVHVHHLDPLSSSRGERRVDPVRQMRPVCPNCHAVLHLRRPPLSVDEVRALIRRNGDTGHSIGSEANSAVIRVFDRRMGRSDASRR